MTRITPEKEATLREVLSEVSLADVAEMLKRGLAALGCWALFFIIILVTTAATDNAGIGLGELGVPDWLIWLALGWIYVYAATSQRSFHEWKVSWYFPKLGWLSSLLLTGYVIGFVYLLIALWHLPQGMQRGAAFFVVWFIYTAPLVGFFAIVNAGYDKLMEKRQSAGAQARAVDEATS